MLINGTYNTSMSGRLTFKNSIYQDAGGRVFVGNFAFGDLNNDGVADAVGVLAESFTGGSMNGISIFAVINENGEPVQSNVEGIGDRTPIWKLRIQNGRIVFTSRFGQYFELDQYYTPVEMTCQLSGHTLYLSRFTSRAVDWRVREVRIANPASGARVACSVQVNGTITEFSSTNNLVYTLSDLAGKEFGNGAIPVKYEKEGGPGTFDETISLRSVPSGISVHLEITENNVKKYGTYIRSRDSVDLISE
jgi:hypothetical protein